MSKHLKINQVKIDDKFWNNITDIVERNMLPYQYLAINDMVDGAEKSYCAENFRKAGKIVEALKNGESVPTYPADKWCYDDNNCDDNAFHGWVFQDTDAYKWLEAVGYTLQKKQDCELEEKANELVELICNAQLDNGYLDTLYIINDRDKCFTNLRDFHELYCFGHLAEAAISYYHGSGDRRLLDATERFADLICDTFNDNGKHGYGGHEIAEMALVKLYEETGKKKYLDTAEFFINERGKKPYYFDIEQGKETACDNYFYNQAHREPRKQNEAVGHAVRGVYLYSGMADVAKFKNDDELFTACKRLWESITKKKMYITGGIGATVDGEAFSFNYDLPNDLAYAESCASIGLIFFAKRMSEADGKSDYCDVIERALYNTVLAGMSDDGKAFFYVNPLEVLPEASHKDSRKAHIKPVRQKWFSCACCPPNIARLIASLNEYIYAENENTIFIEQYIGSVAECDKAVITVKSDYLTNGKVKIDVINKESFALAVRIPEWCDTFSINKEYVLKNGYVHIAITEDTSIELYFSLKPRLIKCSNRVRASVGKAAVMRGPFVYCAEEVDNGNNLQLLKLKADSTFRLDGDMLITDGLRETADDCLYSRYTPANEEACEIRLIPYHKWGNRGENEMSVYLRIKDE